MSYNDFIIINGTRCYFVEDESLMVKSGIIIGYNNTKEIVTIKTKLNESVNEYEIVYRNRNFIWFDLCECLLYAYERAKESSMKTLYIMDLSEQLDGINNTLTLYAPVGDNYTIYYNGLRQNRDDYIVDNENLTLVVLVKPLPCEDDILTIEYWD